MVDYLRPTVDRQDGSIFPWSHPAARQSPFAIPDGQRSTKYLVNGSYPGPTLRAFENDTMEITVVNGLFSEATTIHWHGIHPILTPYMDGARGVTQGPIAPGENFTYRFAAYPPGTHFYHSHMDAVQASRGVRGPIVIERAEDPVKKRFGPYEDKVVWLADEWRDPSSCLKIEGAVPGNDVCADMRHASFDGAFGNGSDAYPFPRIDVEQGKCYRMRFVLAGHHHLPKKSVRALFSQRKMASFQNRKTDSQGVARKPHTVFFLLGSNTENLVISMAGHNMTLVTHEPLWRLRKRERERNVSFFLSRTNRGPDAPF